VANGARSRPADPIAPQVGVAEVVREKKTKLGRRAMPREEPTYCDGEQWINEGKEAASIDDEG